VVRISLDEKVRYLPTYLPTYLLVYLEKESLLTVQLGMYTKKSWNSLTLLSSASVFVPSTTSARKSWVDRV
jgi:hypothetical protein